MWGMPSSDGLFLVSLCESVLRVLPDKATANVDLKQVWDRVIAINLKSYFLFSKQCIPRMLVASRGVIINMASVQGLQSQATAHQAPP